MPRFSYSARSPDGGTETGEIEAADSGAASNALRRRGFTAVQLKAKRFSFNQTISFRSKLRTRDTAALARQLANTQRAGVPTFRSVGALATQFRNTPMGNILTGVEADMANGASLGQAFRKRERELGRLACAMIEAGEATGRLADSLNKLADLLERQSRLRRKVLSAMSYPVFALVLSAVVFFGMVFFVVPIFEEIYTDLDADLPLLTTTLITVARILIDFVILVPLALAALIFGYFRAMKVRDIRRERDRVLLYVPLFGKLLRASTMSRSMSVISSTLGAGVPLLEGISISSQVAGNVLFEDALRRVREAVRDGRSLHYALGQEKVFPELLSRVVETGEEAGTLPVILDSYTTVVAEETETTADNLTTLVEPLLLVFVGAVVSILLAALYLPLFNLSTAI